MVRERTTVLSGRNKPSSLKAAQLPLYVYGDSGSERWVSPELRLVLYLHSEEPNMGTFDYQVTGLSRAEPRPDLFEVPAGCDVSSLEPAWPRGCDGGRASDVTVRTSWESAYTTLKKLAQ